MTAISACSSSLKSLTPERSFPTLRGHPPLIEIGDEFSIPDHIQRPSTGIEIQIPPKYDAIYAAAPLSFYLGAQLTPSKEPLIQTDSGFSYSLAEAGSFEQTTEQLVSQMVTLDAIVRTEGLYPADLYEQEKLEDRVDINTQFLYDAPLADRVERYLEVPFSAVEDIIPEWLFRAYISPDSSSVELIPHLLNDMAFVRTAEVPEENAVEFDGTHSPGELVRSGEGKLNPPEVTSPFQRYPDGEKLPVQYEAWSTERIPVGKNKLMKEGYENRLNRLGVDDDIQAAVVLNDTRMAEESQRVLDIYQETRLPFDVTTYQNPTVDEFQVILQDNLEFLHYIGHIDNSGFICADGSISANSLDDINADAFILNACSSFHEGYNLVEKGAIGGAVSTIELPNYDAVEMGVTVAKLLNRGWNFWGAIQIAETIVSMGEHYIAIGYGGVDVFQPVNGTPLILKIDTGSGEYQVTSYPPISNGRTTGSMYQPLASQFKKWQLNGNKVTMPLELTEKDLEALSDLDGGLRFIGDHVCWDEKITKERVKKYLGPREKSSDP